MLLACLQTSTSATEHTITVQVPADVKDLVVRVGKDTLLRGEHYTYCGTTIAICNLRRVEAYEKILKLAAAIHSQAINVFNLSLDLAISHATTTIPASITFYFILTPIHCAGACFPRTKTIAQYLQGAFYVKKTDRLRRTQDLLQEVESRDLSSALSLVTLRCLALYFRQLTISICGRSVRAHFESLQKGRLSAR